MEVRVFKLVSGEEVMGRLVERSSDNVTIEKTRMIMVGNYGGGQMSIGIVPWINGNPEAKVIISINNIVAEFGALEDLQKAYMQQTSGIVLG